MQNNQKISKVNLKHSGGNSRQPYILPMTNYSDESQTQILNLGIMKDNQAMHTTSQGYFLTKNPQNINLVTQSN